MSVDLSEIAMLMPELASLSVHADLIAIEGAAVLCLKYFMSSKLLFSQLINLT